MLESPGMPLTDILFRLIGSLWLCGTLFLIAARLRTVWRWAARAGLGMVAIAAGVAGWLGVWDGIELVLGGSFVVGLAVVVFTFRMDSGEWEDLGLLGLFVSLTGGMGVLGLLLRHLGTWAWSMAGGLLVAAVLFLTRRSVMVMLTNLVSGRSPRVLHGLRIIGVAGVVWILRERWEDVLFGVLLLEMGHWWGGRGSTGDEDASEP
ncbi:MAG: hypothetical protein OXS33_02325 [bacterium]|nr:hypothetical protein [bacterium]